MIVCNYMWLLTKAIALEPILASKALEKMTADVYFNNSTIRNFMIISFSHDLNQPAKGRGHSNGSVDEYTKTGPMMTKK